jgi:hypothetical protein
VSQRSAKRSAAWLPNCCAQPLNLKLPGELSRYPRRLRGIDMFLKKAWRFLWRGSARATVAGPSRNVMMCFAGTYGSRNTTATCPVTRGD